jgi:hypothetical protein
MYHQREVTRSVLSGAVVCWNQSGRETHTRYWIERIYKSELHNGQMIPKTHATISGANGWLSLRPGGERRAG